MAKCMQPLPQIIITIRVKDYSTDRILESQEPFPELQAAGQGMWNNFWSFDFL